MKTDICTYCGLAGHNAAQCVKRSLGQSIEGQRVAADLSYNVDKAVRLNDEAFIRAMWAQINDKAGETV